MALLLACNRLIEYADYTARPVKTASTGFRLLAGVHWMPAGAHLTALHPQPAVGQGLQIVGAVAGGELLQAAQARKTSM